ncbi:unnamed protein product [Fusarium graminearum]|uniref:Uncharacterized protein n=1 Tax=Gibberella zeae TaxID=5518 RepID=A0A4E9EP56_GIBZA|nr:unnamed protein product [Fusarium graminearum]CAF3630526.1 unnamed protein product [Fusarium graminearum]CAG1971427.1 unnamed protein product [Fusarium graminearum]CAG1985156.1 unnamed protein product [Fusarium graminearum]
MTLINGSDYGATDMICKLMAIQDSNPVELDDLSRPAVEASLRLHPSSVGSRGPLVLFSS